MHISFRTNGDGTVQQTDFSNDNSVMTIHLSSHCLFTIFLLHFLNCSSYRYVPNRCALDFLCNSNFYQFICLFGAVLLLKGENNWCFDCQYNCDELNNNSNNEVTSWFRKIVKNVFGKSVNECQKKLPEFIHKKTSTLLVCHRLLDLLITWENISMVVSTVNEFKKITDEVLKNLLLQYITLIMSLSG